LPPACGRDAVKGHPDSRSQGTPSFPQGVSQGRPRTERSVDALLSFLGRGGAGGAAAEARRAERAWPERRSPLLGGDRRPPPPSRRGIPIGESCVAGGPSSSSGSSRSILWFARSVGRRCASLPLLPSPASSTRSCAISRPRPPHRAARLQAHLGRLTRPHADPPPPHLPVPTLEGAPPAPILIPGVKGSPYPFASSR